MRRAGPAFAALALTLVAAGCAGPPWLMGQPLNGRPSIPDTSAHRTPSQRRQQAATARAVGRPVVEVDALLALDEADRLPPDESVRLADLLVARADDFAALGWGIPGSRDLEAAVRLDPARGDGLRTRRARAARDAGDAWLAIGAGREAGQAYTLAQELGANELSFRWTAQRAEDPGDELSPVTLQTAIAALPLRALPPFARAFLRRPFAADRPLVERMVGAARQAGDATLTARLRQFLAELPASEPTSAVPPPSAAVLPSPPPPDELEAYLLSGPTLARRLLPLLGAAPDALARHPQARLWSELLLAEAATAPDVQEAAALIDGYAGRLGGAERKLTDLTYYTPDRFAGFQRAAAVWRRLGQARLACVETVRAARWRDDPEEPVWRDAVACTRADPGAGDWQAIRAYVLHRTPAERREAVAAELDATGPAVPASPGGRSLP